jgi:hypothetical protein
MDLAKIVQHLRQELADLDAAIASLERLDRSLQQRGPVTAYTMEAGVAVGLPRRRGRKPKNEPGEAPEGE